MKKSIKGTIIERKFRVEPRSDGDKRTFTAALSSEQPVERWFGTEILRHDAKSINMERADGGLPLLFDHDTRSPIGRVLNIRVEGSKTRGELDLSPHNPSYDRYVGELSDGYLKDVSVRYSIDEYETVTDEHGHDTVTATRWTLLEASIVPVPADSTVGVGRSMTETKDMDKEVPTEGEDGGGATVVPMKERQKRAIAKAASEARKGEKQRLADINELFDSCRFQGDAYDSLRERCLDDDSTIEQARAALMDLINSDPKAEVQPVATRTIEDEPVRTHANPFVQAGATSGEKFAEGATRALLMRANVLKPKEAEGERGKNEFSGLSLVDIARAWCHANGLRAPLGTNDVINFVLGEGRRTVGLGTVDFPGIMANVASKSLFAGWEENPSTWRQWCRIGSVPDFKRANRTGLSGADLLDKVPENMEYQRGDLTDRTEYMTAYKYGKLFAFTREAIKNDDLQALSSVPRKMGRAADLTVNKVVYDLLCSASGVGPTLNQDSTALFRTTGKPNYVSSGGAIAVASLEVGRRYMALQVDPNNGLPLNIMPRYLLTPATAYTTGRVLVASEKDPLGTASATGGATTPNPFYNALTVINEPYLDDTGHTNGTTAWYLLADQNMYDTFEVAFVDGASAPYLESRDGWSVDGTEFKVRVEFGVTALDYRAMFRNKGA